MSKLKMVIATVMLLCLELTACSQADLHYEFKGEFIDVSGEETAASFKDFHVMDCCERYDEAVNYASKVHATKPCIGVEIFEYYVYDDTHEPVNTGCVRTVTYHTSEFFDSLDYEKVYVYSLDTGKCYSTEYNGNDVTFDTTEDGYFLVVKHGVTEEKPYICNATECKGQCSSCGGD